MLTEIVNNRQLTQRQHGESIKMLAKNGAKRVKI
jgi:hypothetical protein